MGSVYKEACSSTSSETAWQKQELYVLAQDRRCKGKSYAADFRVKRALFASSQRQTSTGNHKTLRVKVVLHSFPIFLYSQKVTFPQPGASLTPQRQSCSPRRASLACGGDSSLLGTIGRDHPSFCGTFTFLEVPPGMAVPILWLWRR